jgi:selenocysteine lyase/cysteine desulfurase
VKSTDVDALVAALRREGIVTSSRDSNLRISAHCYNAVEDIDAVLDALRRHRSLVATTT